MENHKPSISTFCGKLALNYNMVDLIALTNKRDESQRKVGEGKGEGMYVDI